MVILPNVILTTARSLYSSGTGTTQPVSYLSQVLAHITPNKTSQYTVLPQEALDSQYRAAVETGSDIVAGDMITAITGLDGVTIWPGFNTTATYWVRFSQEQAPLVLPYRMIYIEVVLTGGKAF